IMTAASTTAVLDATHAVVYTRDARPSPHRAATCAAVVPVIWSSPGSRAAAASECSAVSRGVVALSRLPRPAPPQASSTTVANSLARPGEPGRCAATLTRQSPASNLVTGANAGLPARIPASRALVPRPNAQAAPTPVTATGWRAPSVMGPRLAGAGAYV